MYYSNLKSTLFINIQYKIYFNHFQMKTILISLVSVFLITTTKTAVIPLQSADPMQTLINTMNSKIKFESLP